MFRVLLFTVILSSMLFAPNFIHDSTKPMKLDSIIFVPNTPDNNGKSTIAYIKRRCKETRIPERLVFNTIRIESSWKYPTGNEIVGDSMVQSNRSAYGLMQIQLPTAWEMMDDTTITENMLMKNDTLNVEIGIRYLVWLRNYYHGNFYFAITAYNRGISNVDADIDVGYNPASSFTLVTTKGVFFGKTTTRKMREEMQLLREKSVEIVDIINN